MRLALFFTPVVVPPSREALRRARKNTGLSERVVGLGKESNLKGEFVLFLLLI